MKKPNILKLLCKIGIHDIDTTEAVGEVNWAPFYYTKTSCKRCGKRFFKHKNINCLGTLENNLVFLALVIIFGFIINHFF